MADYKKTGIKVFNPSPRQPNFVIAEIVVNIEEMAKYQQENPDAVFEHEKYGKQLKFTIKNSDKGEYYITPNLYRKEEVNTAPPPAPAKEDDGSLPF